MPDRKQLLEYINQLKDKIRHHETLEKMFEEWDADDDVLDLIPIAFDELDVSARTDHGIIYLSYKILDNKDGTENDHYLIHEISHFLQQCYGDKPTTGGESGEDYVTNKYEVEGFQNQTEYISDEYGDEAAEKYIDRVLDHHHLKGKKREDRKEELLQLASLDKNAL